MSYTVADGLVLFALIVVLWFSFVAQRGERYHQLWATE